jgi:mono/diheme cytochrome c family protein
LGEFAPPATRKTSMRVIRTLVLAGFLGGCAAHGAPPPTEAISMSGPTRGSLVAERACASCHAVAIAGDSRNPSAPPFRDIRIRYNTISLERELARIAKKGHFEMPPTAIAETDIPEIVAYIETLRP